MLRKNDAEENNSEGLGMAMSRWRKLNVSPLHHYLTFKSDTFLSVSFSPMTHR
jgi:hypothetical protein